MRLRPSRRDFNCQRRPSALQSDFPLPVFAPRLQGHQQIVPLSSRNPRMQLCRPRSRMLSDLHLYHPSHQHHHSCNPFAVVQTPVSRTTEWRRRKAATEGMLPTAKTARKQYGCRVRGQAMSSPGHTQFRGQRYCPDARPNTARQKKAESLAKAVTKQN